MLLSIKTKLKLNKSQATIMSKHAGIARFTYNWGMSAWSYLYKDGLKPNKYLLKKFFNNHVKAVGVDLGVKELAVLSTGVVFPNPKHYKAHLTKLKRLSRVLARKVKDFSNRLKAKLILARHHAKIANLRKNTLHQITTYLCKNHATIVVEDLKVGGMLKNHNLAQVIADCGFHEFKRQLEYKAKKFGCEVIIADRWFPPL